MKRAPIQKTYKLFIGGKFPRSESGHYFSMNDPKSKKPIANISRASRKDFREAVGAARKAFDDWSSRTAYNRGQILYRMAEMMEARASELCDRICEATGTTKPKAEKEVQAAIDRMVWYAGWADKYQQIFGSVNPVAAPYFNFTMPDATGVVTVLASDELGLLPLISQIAPVIVSGNTVVAIASEQYPTVAITLAEIISTSDVPGGVINILTGIKSELIEHIGKHMDVNAVHYVGTDKKVAEDLRFEGTENLKRVVIKTKPVGADWFKDNAQSPYWIQNFVEMKTTWHPVGS